MTQPLDPMEALERVRISRAAAEARYAAGADQRQRESEAYSVAIRERVKDWESRQAEAARVTARDAEDAAEEQRIDASIKTLMSNWHGTALDALTDGARALVDEPPSETGDAPRAPTPGGKTPRM